MEHAHQFEELMKQASAAEPTIMKAVDRMMARCIVAGTTDSKGPSDELDIDVDYVTDLSVIILKESVTGADREKPVSDEELDIWFAVLFLTANLPGSVAQVHRPSFAGVIPDELLFPINGTEAERYRIGAHIAKKVLDDVDSLKTDVSSQFHAVVVAFMATSTWLSNARSMGAYNDQEMAELVENIREQLQSELRGNQETRLH